MHAARCDPAAVAPFAKEMDKEKQSVCCVSAHPFPRTREAT